MDVAFVEASSNKPDCKGGLADTMIWWLELFEESGCLEERSLTDALLAIRPI